jgi:GNAT superfamily N-acetyltransferase
MNYDIVEASIDDAEAVADVTLRSLKASYNDTSPDREGVIRNWQAYIRKEHPQTSKEPRVIYAAIAGGEMVGYIAGHLTERFGMDGELESIYILYEHQRRGLGTRLVIELAKWFQTWNVTKVCVDAVPQSQGFYLKLEARPFRGPWLVWDNFLDVLHQQQKEKNLTKWLIYNFG